MPKYAERFTLASNGTLRAQVKVALIVAATNIASEPTDADFHKPRRAFAAQVLKNPDGFSQQFTSAVAAWPEIALENNTDDTVQFIVNSLWNAFAVSDDSNPAGSLPVSAQPKTDVSAVALK